MAALKSIIMLDQSNKKWLSEDYDNLLEENHELQSANTTINCFLFAIAVLLTAILYIVVKGL